jgi:hypothetical protein
MAERNGTQVAHLAKANCLPQYPRSLWTGMNSSKNTTAGITALCRIKYLSISLLSDFPVHKKTSIKTHTFIKGVLLFPAKITVRDLDTTSHRVLACERDNCLIVANWLKLLLLISART